MPSAKFEGAGFYTLVLSQSIAQTGLGPVQTISYPQFGNHGWRFCGTSTVGSANTFSGRSAYSKDQADSGTAEQIVANIKSGIATVYHGVYYHNGTKGTSKSKSIALTEGATDPDSTCASGGAKGLLLGAGLAVLGLTFLF